MKVINLPCIVVPYIHKGGKQSTIDASLGSLWCRNEAEAIWLSRRWLRRRHWEHNYAAEQPDQPSMYVRIDLFASARYIRGLRKRHTYPVQWLTKLKCYQGETHQVTLYFIITGDAAWFAQAWRLEHPDNRADVIVSHLDFS
jgi:hypothetical protein